ncbi:hypothetical protein MtrunA17_Chr6g0476601 [Medicago truncatula]|uniref:Uncharacterized protein n=1 Tax=Medicago truncatula TaxID=3880 RepID=A0A396HHT7_MEDTR|nr:hypothetical protein MtrunA17_Chr6g0476601 [Medicago truncatula]
MGIMKLSHFAFDKRNNRIESNNIGNQGFKLPPIESNNSGNKGFKFPPIFFISRVHAT